jgi:uncharacterized protein (TIGR02588 family)
MAEEKKSKQEDNEPTQTPFLEWVFAVIGLILVIGVIGFLIYEIATDQGKPANLNVKIEEIIPNNKGFLVRFTLENTGDETAADVTVEGELKKGAESLEKSDVTVDYVPSHSEKKGGMFFTEDPRSNGFTIRAKGFNEP